MFSVHMSLIVRRTHWLYVGENKNGEGVRKSADHSGKFKVRLNCKKKKKHVMTKVSMIVH